MEKTIEAQIYSFERLIFLPEIVQQELPNGEVVQTQKMVPHPFNKEEFFKQLEDLMVANPNQIIQVCYGAIPTDKCTMSILEQNEND
jgi:hypothetical protein